MLALVPLHFQLVGPSMLPTFNHGSFVLSERITVRSGKVGSGDTVVIRSPEDPRKVVCKRVRAVEGDVVSYQQKTVVIFFVFPTLLPNSMLILICTSKICAQFNCSNWEALVVSSINFLIVIDDWRKVDIFLIVYLIRRYQRGMFG